MKLGILNGGGDCAGLNAVTRAVVRKSEQFGYDVIGIKHGWAGLLEIDTIPLKWSDVAHMVNLGGTILHTTRTNPFGRKDGPETVLANVKKLGLDVIVAVGGEDTLSVAARFVPMGLKVVGIPKTIDNDIVGTDMTFGFDSAVNVTVEAIDRIQTTGSSHDRVMVVEVMGRHAGWIAAYAGVASGANLILVPEEPFDLDEVANFLKMRHASGANASVVVVGEGCSLKGLPTGDATKVETRQPFEAFRNEQAMPPADRIVVQQQTRRRRRKPTVRPPSILFRLCIFNGPELQRQSGAARS